MGLFSRSAPDGPTDATPDPEFPMLDRQRAADFRKAVLDELRSKGMEAVITDRAARVSDGSQYGLDNIVRICADATSPQDLRDRVRGHFAGIFERPDTADFSDAEYRAALRLRLIPEYQATGAPESGSVVEPLFRPFARDLVSVVVLDTPSAVVTPSESAVLRHGDADEMLRLARENTWRELVSSPIERFRTGGGGDDWAMSAMGESFYTASAAQFLPEILQHWHPGLDLSLGVLFAVPFRHRMLYRVVDTPESVSEGLPFMAKLAAGGFEQEAGHTSPLCYLWHQGEITAVSLVSDSPDGRRTLTLAPGPHLEHFLSR